MGEAPIIVYFCQGDEPPLTTWSLIRFPVDVDWAGGRFRAVLFPERPVGRSSVLHLHSDYGAASPPHVRGGVGAT